MTCICREVYQHKEAYVRRAVLYAAACIVIALHPTYIATALLEGNTEISAGLDWIRTWALEVAESDTDRECYMVRRLGASKKGLESRLPSTFWFYAALQNSFAPFFLILNMLLKLLSFVLILWLIIIDGYEMHSTSWGDGSSNYKSFRVSKRFFQGKSCSAFQCFQDDG